MWNNHVWETATERETHLSLLLQQFLSRSRRRLLITWHVSDKWRTTNTSQLQKLAVPSNTMQHNITQFTLWRFMCMYDDTILAVLSKIRKLFGNLYTRTPSEKWSDRQSICKAYSIWTDPYLQLFQDVATLNCTARLHVASNRCDLRVATVRCYALTHFYC